MEKRNRINTFLQVQVIHHSHNCSINYLCLTLASCWRMNVMHGKAHVHSHEHANLHGGVSGAQNSLTGHFHSAQTLGQRASCSP